MCITCVHRKKGKSSTAESSSSQTADAEADDSKNSDEKARLAQWVRNMRRTAVENNLGIRFSVTFAIPV
jgi:hypothetical protein